MHHSTLHISHQTQLHIVSHQKIPFYITFHNTFITFASHHFSHHTTTSQSMPPDHIAHNYTGTAHSASPPHYMPHHISHRTPFYTTSGIAPPHLTSHNYTTCYAVHFILHEAIPHCHIALQHIAHHSCISHIATLHYNILYIRAAFHSHIPHCHIAL